ncbi:hypothetical protein PLCT2_00270 [Planctomycetaceae bacterium]|nr:hypothetical protein PLCT2_00270 [Planctomycetaceae bacterium]
MQRGRPPQQSALVDALSGPEEDKRRLRVILATITGELSIPQACIQLDGSESRLFDLRKQALEAALQGIKPGKPGRPSKEQSAEEQQIQELKQKAKDLEYQLYTRQVRDELLASLPHVLIRSNELSQYAQKKRGILRSVL